MNTIGSFKCVDCPKGQFFNLEDKSCYDIDECKNNNGGCDTKCENTFGSYFCTCNEGYQLDESYHRCVDINECERDNEICGGVSAKCINLPGEFKCACTDEGYLVLGF